MEAQLQALLSDFIRKGSARAVRLTDVCNLTGASKTTIWRWVKHDPGFPRPFKLSQAVTCWDEGEILDWVQSKKADPPARSVK